MAFIVIRPLTWKEVGGRLSLNLIILCVLLILDGILSIVFNQNSFGLVGGAFAIALGLWGILAALTRNRFLLFIFFVVVLVLFAYSIWVLVATILSAQWIFIIFVALQLLFLGVLTWTSWNLFQFARSEHRAKKMPPTVQQTAPPTVVVENPTATRV